MRDILLLMIICGAALRALRHPWVGVILWTWVSVMSPHSQFGWQAGQFPVAMIAGVCTLIGLLMTKDRQNPFLAPPVWALLCFTILVTATLPLSFDLDDSMWLWNRSMKIFLMIFVSIALINTRQKLNYFVAIITFSIGFYGFKGGIFTIVNGGNFRVWGPPGGFIEGNNEIALALVMTIPLIRYLQLQAQKKWLRSGLGLTMLLTAVTVLGTYSRGALLALGAMAVFLWLKGEKKLLWGVLLICTTLAILPLMPEAWWDRMNTIKTYEEDGSAMGRINAWHMAWNLAKSNLFGGGFSIYNRSTFQAYAPVPDDIHAAHSIYFQIMGEHGFIGLAIFLVIWILTWTSARRTMALARGDASLKWAVDLASMIQVSLIGFFVGGAFLSLAYFDLPYDMMAVVVVALNLVSRHVAGALKSASVPPAKPIDPTGAVTVRSASVPDKPGGSVRPSTTAD